MALIAELVTALRVEQTKFRADMEEAKTYAKGTADRMSSEISAKLTHGFSVAALTGTAAFTKIGHAAKNMLTNVGNEIAHIGKRLTQLGTIAIIAAPALILREIVQTATALDTLADSAEALGIAASDVQKFTFATKSLGGTDTLSLNFLGESSKRLGEFSLGIGRAGTILKKFGVDLKQFSGLDPTQGILKLAEVTKEMSQPQRVKVFESYAAGMSKLLPLLKEGSGSMVEMNKEFASLGIGLTKTQFGDIGLFTDSLDKLRSIWEAFKASITANVAGPLASLVKEITGRIMEAGGIKSAAEKVAGYILEAIKSFLMGIQLLVDATKKLAEIISSTYNAIAHPLDSMRGNPIIPDMSKIDRKKPVWEQKEQGGVQGGNTAIDFLSALQDKLQVNMLTDAFRNSASAANDATLKVAGLASAYGLLEGAIAPLKGASDLASESVSKFGKETKLASEKVKTTLENLSESLGRSEMTRIFGGAEKESPLAKNIDFDNAARSIVKNLENPTINPITGNVDKQDIIASLRLMANEMLRAGGRGENNLGMRAVIEEMQKLVRGNKDEKSQVDVKISVTPNKDFDVKIEATAKKAAVSAIADEARKVAA